MNNRRLIVLSLGLLTASGVILGLYGIARAVDRADAATSSETASAPSGAAAAGDWRTDPVWYDGLVEKATYDASRVIYGRPRAYTAVAFTNKEQHDRQTMTKTSGSTDTVEVFKHNWREDVPTPNYVYHFTTTSHFTTDESLEFVRLDVGSQEYCGTSFKQYLRKPGAREIDYWSFSYMPEAGRVSDTIRTDTRKPTVAHDGLSLWLRSYDFQNRPTLQIALLPDQTSNRETSPKPLDATVKYVALEDDGHRLEVSVDGRTIGTYWMAPDRLHVMTRYEGVDGQTYRLTGLERSEYWTIKGE